MLRKSPHSIREVGLKYTFTLLLPARVVKTQTDQPWIFSPRSLCILRKHVWDVNCMTLCAWTEKDDVKNKDSIKKHARNILSNESGHCPGSRIFQPKFSTVLTYLLRVKQKSDKAGASKGQRVPSWQPSSNNLSIILCKLVLWKLSGPTLWAVEYISRQRSVSHGLSHWSHCSHRAECK